MRAQLWTRTMQGNTVPDGRQNRSAAQSSPQNRVAERLSRYLKVSNAVPSSERTQQERGAAVFGLSAPHARSTTEP